MECQYDLQLTTVLTSTLRHTDFTHKKLFALVRKLSEEHWGTELRKFLASLLTYTKSSFRLSECKWTSGWPAHTVCWYEHSLESVSPVQPKPDLLQTEPVKENPWGESCSTALLPARLCTQKSGKAQGSDLIDSPFGRAVLRGAGWGHVERLCLPFQPGSFVSQHQAAPAWADDLRNELFAVYTHLHGAPVLHELFGKLELFIGFVHRLWFWGEPGVGEPTKNI